MAYLLFSIFFISSINVWCASLAMLSPFCLPVYFRLFLCLSFDSNFHLNFFFWAYLFISILISRHPHHTHCNHFQYSLIFEFFCSFWLPFTFWVEGTTIIIILPLPMRIIRKSKSEEKRKVYIRELRDVCIEIE